MAKLGDEGEAPAAPTILVVDDTPVNLQVLVRILDGSGYRTLVARDGRTALEIARRARPDLVLLDVVMPGMDGFEVCRALKQDPVTRGAVVVFLSALGDVAGKVSGLELGAGDYITKPFHAEEVLARVEGQLFRQRLERELRRSRDSLTEELRSAGEMQRLLLPRALPADGRITFAAHYRASLHAGGDYYDVWPLPGGRVGIFVADVSGHGARAAIIMAMMRTLLHSSGVAREDPAAVFEALNRHFGYLWELSIFATVLYAVIDPAAGGMRIACAGHPPPLLLRQAEPIAPLRCEVAIPLFIQELESVPLSEHALVPGDRLAFYTDGITETRTAAGELFGIERLVRAIGDHAARGPEEIVGRVVAEVESFAPGVDPQDDQTLLLASVN